MIIRPELAALQLDDSPQRRIQARLVAQAETWHSSGRGGAIRAELACLADGAMLEDLPLLSAMFAPGDPAARAVVEELTGWLLGELAEAPLGQVPLRHFTDGMLSTLLLARVRGVTLSLQAIDGTALTRRRFPASASFAASEVWEHVLAGCGTAEIVRIVGSEGATVRFDRRPLRLEPGHVAHRQGAEAVQLLRAVEGCLVTLKLQRRVDDAAVTREYRLDDGALLHQASGSPRTSRLELTAALLGRMGRSDAAPLLAAMAEEHGSTHLRWQALREALGLDAQAGFAALTALALRPDDPLALPAGALRAQLLETYPQLAGACPCPA